MSNEMLPTLFLLLIHALKHCPMLFTRLLSRVCQSCGAVNLLVCLACCNTDCLPRSALGLMSSYESRIVAAQMRLSGGNFSLLRATCFIKDVGRCLALVSCTAIVTNTSIWK